MRLWLRIGRLHRAAARAAPHIVADATTKSVAGDEVGVIVWGCDQVLSGLEVYNYTAESPVLSKLASIAELVRAGGGQAAMTRARLVGSNLGVST